MTGPCDGCSRHRQAQIQLEWDDLGVVREGELTAGKVHDSSSGAGLVLTGQRAHVS